MEKELDELVAQMFQIWHLLKKESPTPHSAATLLQIQSLVLIKKSPAIVMNQFANHLGLSFSSAAQLVERLYQSDLIKREKDKSDRRITKLILSAKGLRTLHKMKEKRKARLKQVFSQIPKKDIEDLIKVQKRLLTHLENN